MKPAQFEIDFEHINKYRIFKDIRYSDHFYAIRNEKVGEYDQILSSLEQRSNAEEIIFINVIPLKVEYNQDSKIGMVKLHTQHQIEIPIEVLENYNFIQIPGN